MAVYSRNGWQFSPESAQAPILAAAGANVTVLDNSPVQLDKDSRVAEQTGLSLETVDGNMQDLSVFGDDAFDLVINPVSIVYVPEVQSVWNEVCRILKPEGDLMCGFGNPAKFIFDRRSYEDTGEMVVVNKLPYSESESLSETEKLRLASEGEPLYHSHSLELIVGGMIAAGLAITGFYEDNDPVDSVHTMPEYFPQYIVLKATKSEAN